MDPTTIRLPADTLAALDSEYSDYGYSTRADYMRAIIEHRDPPYADTPTTSDYERPTTADYERLRERVAALEESVEASCDDRDSEPAEPTAPLPDDLPQQIDRGAARAAIAAAAAHIERDGGATMRELVADVMPEHPLGYDVPALDDGERFRGAWWRRVVRPGLEAHEHVAKPPRGGSEWRWVG